MEKAMVSLGKYLLVVQVLVLIEISRITALQSCSSSTIIELKASTTPSSYLTSPNYPSKYPPSQKCQWKITAPIGHVIILTFLDLYIEGRISLRNNGCPDWLSDRLDIYDGDDSDGKLLGRYCSTYLPPKVFSSGTSLFLEFISDKYTERRGFKLEYSATVPKPDINICSPFNTFSQNNNIQLSGSSGYIESPLYGSKYPSNMQCTWVITVSEGKEIKLTFLDFIVGQKGFFSCSTLDDYVEIRDGQSKESNLINYEYYCSSSKPSSVRSSGRHLWIRFISNSDNYIDEDNVRKTNGFRARYEEEMSGEVGTVIGVVVAVIIVFALIFVCVALRRRRRRRRPPSGAQVTQAQTTLTYNRQTPSAPSYPTVHYSPAPQSSYPPPSSGYPPSTQDSNQQPQPGSYPMSSTGGAGYTAQPSAAIKSHPSGTFLNDPPPTYPEAVLDVPPPPYPGIVSQNPPQVPTTQHPATS